MRGLILVTVLSLSLALSACGGTPAPDMRAAETQIAAKIFATQTASAPTPTDIPQATAAIPPRGAYKHGYEITEEFDRFKGSTAVTLHPRPAEFFRGPGSLLSFYIYEGTTPAVPLLVDFLFYSRADDWQYLKCHDLSLLLDGQIRMPLEAKYGGDVGSGYVTEYVESRLSVDEFLRIVNATKVEGKLCNTEFVLSSEQMEALRDLASRMQP